MVLAAEAGPKSWKDHAEEVDDLARRGVVGKPEEVEDVLTEGRPAPAHGNPMKACHPKIPWRLRGGHLQAVLDSNSEKLLGHTGPVCEGLTNFGVAAAEQDCDPYALGRRGEDDPVLARSAAWPGVASLVARRLFCWCRQVAWDRNRRT